MPEINLDEETQLLGKEQEQMIRKKARPSNSYSNKDLIKIENESSNEGGVEITQKSKY